MKADPACKGQPLEVFYEDLWKRDGVPWADGLARARSFCDQCPVATGCLATAMKNEHGQAEMLRTGVYAGLTGPQRYSLEKRGGVVGDVPIPDRGDQWTDRHTELAAEVIAWAAEHVEVGGEMPSGTKLGRQLQSRPADVRRVYTALVEDTILVEVDGKLRRSDIGHGSVRKYCPPHLRSVMETDYTEHSPEHQSGE